MQQHFFIVNHHHHQIFHPRLTGLINAGGIQFGLVCKVLSASVGYQIYFAVHCCALLFMIAINIILQWVCICTNAFLIANHHHFTGSSTPDCLAPWILQLPVVVYKVSSFQVYTSYDGYNYSYCLYIHVFVDLVYNNRLTGYCCRHHGATQIHHLNMVM